MSGTASGLQKELGIAVLQGVPSDLPEDVVRRVVGKKDPYHRWIDLGLRSDLLNVDWTAIEAVLQSKANPYASNIKKPVWDYPAGWQMPSWEDQLKVLTGIYPDLPTDGLQEMAEMYLAREDIWGQNFVWLLTGDTVPVWDGLEVFPLPGRIAQTQWDLDLWADVVKEKKGGGLWGRLCEEILFPQFTLPADDPRFLAFYNNRQGAMRSDRFLPLDEVASWFQEMEQEVRGGFACRPVSFGRYTAGHAVESSRWIAANELGAVPGCTWLGGHGLIVSPSRLSEPGILALDLPGDRYRFGAGREFLSAPCFDRFAARLVFGTHLVAFADEDCGSLLVLRQ